MSAAEAAVFRRDANFEVALAMRSWDEEAKYPGLDVPAFETCIYMH